MKRSDALIKRAQKWGPKLGGIGLDAVAAVPLDAELIADIAGCLLDADPEEVSWGLFFCEGLVAAEKLPAGLEPVLVQSLKSSWCEGNEHLRRTAAPLLVRLQKHFPQYREWMIAALRDPNPGTRGTALSNTGSFLEENEITPLLPFQNDSYILQIRPNGPLVYFFRDVALDTIKKMIGKKFAENRLSEPSEDGYVTWQDWTPFRKWIEGRQSMVVPPS